MPSFSQQFLKGSNIGGGGGEKDKKPLLCRWRLMRFCHGIAIRLSVTIGDRRQPSGRSLSVRFPTDSNSGREIPDHSWCEIHWRRLGEFGLENLKSRVGDIVLPYYCVPLFSDMKAT